MFPDLTRDDVFRLETSRLWLRWPRQADVPAIVRLAGERVVAKMTTSIPHPFPVEAGEHYLFETRRGNAEGRGLQLAITPKAKPDRLIGIVGVKPSSEDGRPHLGCWIGVPHWGQGFATEAAQALIDAFFAYTSHVELISSACVLNPASRRVLEKSGFTHQGSASMTFPARGGAFPVHRFRLNRRAWDLSTWNRADLSGQARPEERRGEQASGRKRRARVARAQTAF